MVFIPPAAFLMLAGPVQPECPEVRVEDALAFNVTPHEARSGWLLARDHGRLMREIVICNNPPDVVRAWEEEIRWRLDVWDALDYVLFCDLPVKSKLVQLERLRRLLGDADFYGGRVPAPIPGTYRLPYRP